MYFTDKLGKLLRLVSRLRDAAERSPGNSIKKPSAKEVIYALPEQGAVSIRIQTANDTRL
jgi:hypothetical protein